DAKHQTFRVRRTSYSLEDNRAKYLDWKHFDLEWLFSNQVFNSINICPSEIPQDFCSPQWICITEPTICPEYGYQTQTCKDYGCENQEIKSQISCNPGICSGCLVPKWFESNAIGDNRCIPYGFRFESQIGWNLELQDGKQSVTLRINDTQDEGVSFSISPKGVVKFNVKDWGNQNYTFVKGDTVKVNVEGWQNEITNLSFFVDEVFYDSENYENSYIRLTLTYTALGRVADTINAYCDIDGTVKPQKEGVKDVLIKCQNNYECSSNQCSNGICIGLGAQIDTQTGLFKSIGCRILNIVSLGSVNYRKCILGDNATNPSP
ncbi:hypothetical protein GW931_01585, partial [archaeon]|nr:hypothetical protein [archaeon]